MNQKQDLKNMTTLVQILYKGKYLMMHRTKKKNDVNQEKWIGIGGHLKEGETPEEGAVREVKEETGLSLSSLTLRTVVTFLYAEPTAAHQKQYDTHIWQTDGFYDQCEYMFVFSATISDESHEAFLASKRDCPEGELAFISPAKLYQKEIWEGDRIFLSEMENGAPFFTLKLGYLGNRLIEAKKNGTELELLDILDEKGEKTGLTRARFLAHRDGTIHPTAHVWIARKRDGVTELMLQKRSMEKDSFPGFYDISSAGHVPAGYDYAESAVRELFEELGIVTTPDRLTFVGMHKGIWKEQSWKSVGQRKEGAYFNYEWSAVFLYCDPVEDQALVFQPGEVDGIRWEPYEEVLSHAGTVGNGYCLYEDEILMLKAPLDNF